MQKLDESLREYGSDIEILLSSAYPQVLEEFLEQFGVQAFIDGLRDTEMQQALRLRHHLTQQEVLTFAQEVEAAKTISKTRRPKLRAMHIEKENLTEVMARIVNLLKDTLH